MTKSELVELLKCYKENKAKLNIRLKELKLARIKLKSLEEVDVSLSVSYGLNQDIHSKNNISDKVGKEVEQNDIKRIELEEEVKDLQEEIRKGKEKVLFATYGLAKEGLDIPRLDRLILASPHRDKATIIQSIGRIERKFENKNNPICYDLVDPIKYFLGMYKSRKSYYKKNNNKLLE